MPGPVPPELLPCPLCTAPDAGRHRCYMSSITSTGVQVWAYSCDVCETWWRVRWTPQQPTRYLVCDQSKRKPGQTAMARSRQQEMGL